MDNITWPAEKMNNTCPACTEEGRVKTRQFRKHLLLLGLLAALLLFLGLFPYRLGMILGDSMLPAMKSDHLFVMSRDPYTKVAPERNDVVVFKHRGVTMVKRVAAISSDTVWLLKGRHGTEVVPEDSVEQLRTVISFYGLGATVSPFVVPEGSVFVLGDNAMNSEDSRDYGPVPISEIKGKVVYTENWKFLDRFRKPTTKSLETQPINRAPVR